MRQFEWFSSVRLTTPVAWMCILAACSGAGGGGSAGADGSWPGIGGSIGSPASGGATSSSGGIGGAIGAGGTTAGRGGASGMVASASGGGSGKGGTGSGGVSAPGGAGYGGTSGGSAGGSSAGTGGAAGAPAPGKKFCGNITTGGQVRSDFIMYWDQITPENEGKWGSVEGTRNQMTWSGLDRIHDYAKQHNIPFKQHNFVWGSRQPSWIGGLSAADQAKEVEEWIRLFCERYPDTQMIDVVNEPPPHTTPTYTAALGGAGASGYDWIVQSFKWARQYCPNSILILNDYNTIEYANDNTHFIDIVNKIKTAGAPIDVIGAQAHAAHSMSTSSVQMYLDKLATSTGLPVYISEYDIDEADNTKQKNIMQEQFTMFWNDANVKGVTVWGYVVGQTWQTNSGLMTSSGTMRPAMTWLMQFLGRP